MEQKLKLSCRFQLNAGNFLNGWWIDDNERCSQFNLYKSILWNNSSGLAQDRTSERGRLFTLGRHHLTIGSWFLKFVRFNAYKPGNELKKRNVLFYFGGKYLSLVLAIFINNILQRVTCFWDNSYIVSQLHCITGSRNDQRDWR